MRYEHCGACLTVADQYAAGLIVDDPSIKAQICKAAWNQKQIEDAGGIVLCADLSAKMRDDTGKMQLQQCKK